VIKVYTLLDGDKAPIKAPAEGEKSKIQMAENGDLVVTVE